MRDLFNNQDAVNSLNTAARTATTNGTGVDLQGFEGAMATVVFGTWTDGTHTPSLQESDDNSTFTNVAAGDQQGTFTAVNAAGGSNTIQRVGYLGTKRFVRVVMTCAGTTTGAVTGAHVVRGYGRHKGGSAV